MLRGPVISTDDKPTASKGCLAGEAWIIDAADAGRLAQLVERLLYTERVGGSSPSPPTIGLVHRFVIADH